MIVAIPHRRVALEEEKPLFVPLSLAFSLEEIGPERHNLKLKICGLKFASNTPQISHPQFFSNKNFISLHYNQGILYAWVPYIKTLPTLNSKSTNSSLSITLP